MQGKLERNKERQVTKGDGEQGETVGWKINTIGNVAISLGGKCGSLDHGEILNVTLYITRFVLSLLYLLFDLPTSVSISYCRILYCVLRSYRVSPPSLLFFKNILVPKQS